MRCQFCRKDLEESGGAMVAASIFVCSSQGECFDKAQELLKTASTPQQCGAEGCSSECMIVSRGCEDEYRLCIDCWVKSQPELSEEPSSA